MIKISLLFSLLISNSVYANFILDNTKIDGILELKDPFETPKFEKKRLKERGTTHRYLKDGIYTNLEDNRENIELEQLELENLEIVGIIRGDINSARVKMKDQKDSFTLKEGMKVGSNGIVLKSILPGGLVFVYEETSLYGEKEFHEIIIPIKKAGLGQ